MSKLEPEYLDGDDPFQAISVKEFSADTPFQKRLLRAVRAKRFQTAGRKKKAKVIENKMTPKDASVGSLIPKEYVDGIIDWASKINHGGSTKGFIPLDTIMSMILDPSRLSAWRARNGGLKAVESDDNSDNFGF